MLSRTVSAAQSLTLASGVSVSSTTLALKSIKVSIREILQHPNHTWFTGNGLCDSEKQKREKKKEALESICKKQQNTNWYQNIPATNNNEHKKCAFHRLIRSYWTFSSFGIFLTYSS